MLDIKLNQSRYRGLPVHPNLVICGLFICNFAYVRLKICHFSGTYPLICRYSWSFYMRAWFFGPYLSHITRSTCTSKVGIRSTYVRFFQGGVWVPLHLNQRQEWTAVVAVALQKKPEQPWILWKQKRELVLKLATSKNTCC